MYKDLTAAQRKRDERARNKKEGWVQFNSSKVRPHWIPKIKEFIERMRFFELNSHKGQK